MREKLHAFFIRMEIDRAVIYGVSVRVWQFLSGPITAFIIAFKLSPEIQGFYYTFYSLIALQVFAELGLGQVIIQFASHEWAHLSLNDNCEISGDKKALCRLISLGRLVFVWYAIAGMLIIIGLAVAGIIFFSRQTHDAVQWFMPWIALCIFTGLNFLLLPVLSLLEGCNQVARVYSYRFYTAVITGLSVWISICTGAELWVPAISLFVTFAAPIPFIITKYRRFFSVFFTSVPSSGISWKEEIFPFQWRIALSWLSGYFTFQLFTPALFHFHGPVVAGQMGMTLSLVRAIAAISSTWVMTKVPKFGQLAAKKAYAVLDKMVLRNGTLSVLVALAASVFFLALLSYLNFIQHPLCSRLLSPVPAGIFLLATVLVQITYPQAAYLRAHKREPFLWISVITGILVALSSIFLGKYYSVIGVVTGYLFIIAFVVLPVCTIIFFRCRTSWQKHALA